jgi:transcriptional regulator with XRE-family HTH domain
MLDRKSFYLSVGKKVKQARENRNITQEELASKVSLSRTSITNIEQGRQQFMAHTLIEIATALAVSPTSLLPEINTKFADTLDDKLKDLPPNERRWIKSTLKKPAKTRA